MKEKAYSLFKSHFQLRESTKGWYRFVNPFDTKAVMKRNSNMAVNFEYLWVKDFKSGYSVHITKFLQEYFGISYSEVKKLIGESSSSSLPKYTQLISPVKTIGLPEGYKSLINPNSGTLGKRAIRYLQKRGFDPEILDAKGWGYCTKGRYQGYIIIPYQVEGKLTYYIGRSFMDHENKYLYPKNEDVGVGKNDVLYNADALFIHNEVYITEGAIDAETWGDNCIALGG